MVKLSQRLFNVSELITPGLRVADIGTDHGFLPIYLYQNNIAKSVIASDVKIGPLQKAAENLEIAELSDKIDLRLSDGLKMYDPGEVDSIVMAGMGGNLMIDIISNSMDVCDKAHELILQPQSDVAKVRHFLQDNGYMIISESMVCEDGKFYPMMKAVHQEQCWDEEIDFIYGKILLREQNPVLHEFLIIEKEYLVDLYRELSCREQTQAITVRTREVERSLGYNQQALDAISATNPIEKDRIIR